MGLVIAGERSGSGKTTVTLAILAALRQQGRSVQSFKVGPDYIDPMFHRSVTGRPCYNLDPVLTSEQYVQQAYHRYSQTAPYAAIEGVMGLFDGAASPIGFASTAHIAKLLQVPVLLVINCRSLSQSIAALVQGYKTFDPAVRLVGLVLNQVGSDRHLEILKAALEPLNLPILGVLRREDAIALPDRHLGLVPTGELENFREIRDRLADLGQRCFDWERLLPLLQVTDAATTGAGLGEIQPIHQINQRSIRIAIAQDAAFNFYYPDNLEQLQHLGVEIVPWSPLQDPKLPEACQGLYFGGGFPEVFAAALSENRSAQASVKAAIAAKVPVYAECGGLMYLCESIVDFAEMAYPMVGALPTQAHMGKRLTLGYRRAQVQTDTPLVRAGQTLSGHEFHRSSLLQTPNPAIYALQPWGNLADSPSIAEGWIHKNLHASYLHLHWGATPQIPQRFVQHCLQREPIR